MANSKKGSVPKMQNPPPPNGIPKRPEFTSVIVEPPLVAPNKRAKIISTILQWLVVATVLFFIFRGFHYKIPETRPMPGYLVALFGISGAYVWVDVLRWGVSKPFNCLACLSGWFGLILAFVFHTHYWYLYLPLGGFIGGLFTSIRLRWL